MMAMPNPTSPPPLMPPSSAWVNPNWLPQSARMNPRTENPMPAAMRVKKLAQKRNFSFVPTDWAGACTGRGGCDRHEGEDSGRGRREVEAPVKCGG